MNTERQGIIPSEEAWTIVRNEGGVFVDVRSEKEVNEEGILPNAVHIPHDEMPERITELDEHKDKTIVCYCAVGGRVEKVRSLFNEHGFTQFVNAGGYKGLKASE